MRIDKNYFFNEYLLCTRYSFSLPIYSFLTYKEYSPTGEFCKKKINLMNNYEHSNQNLLHLKVNILGKSFSIIKKYIMDGDAKKETSN